MKEIKHTELGSLKIETSYWQRINDNGKVVSGYIKNTVINDNQDIVYEEMKDTMIKNTDSFLEKFLMQLSGSNKAKSTKNVIANRSNFINRFKSIWRKFFF